MELHRVKESRLVWADHAIFFYYGPDQWRSIQHHRCLCLLSTNTFIGRNSGDLESSLNRRRMTAVAMASAFLHLHRPILY